MFSESHSHQRNKSHQDNLIPGLGSIVSAHKCHFPERLLLSFWAMKAELARKDF